MATGSFVLDGARGKVGNLVARKGPKGGTVLSQRVIPRNPQTDNQMIVRCALGTLATAGAKLWQIVGQTFESSVNEATNRRMFTRANIRYLMAEGMKGMHGNITTGAFCPKDGRYLVPNAYVISQGSLESPENLMFREADNENVLVLPTFSVRISGTLTAAKLWQLLFGLRPGQQATFVMIHTKNGENVAYDVAAQIGYEEGLGKDIVRYARMTSHRLVLKSGGGSEITFTNETTVEELVACLASLVDTSITSEKLWDAQGTGAINRNFTLGEGIVEFDGYDMTGWLNIDGYKIQAAGVIISQFNGRKWQYNRTVMAQLAPEYYDSEPFANERYGLNIQEAVDSYRRGQSSKSDLYTQQGGEVNDIGGNSGSGGSVPLRMVSRLTSGSPITLNGDQDGSYVTVATFNRPFTKEELIGKLQVIAYEYDSEGPNTRTEILTAYEHIQDPTDENSIYVGPSLQSQSRGRLYINGMELQVRKRSFITNADWLFDIDFDHQHQRPFEINGATYLLQLPNLIESLQYYAIVNIDIGEQDDMYIYIETDANDPYIPMCDNVELTDLDAGDWFTGDRTQGNFESIAALLKILINFEYNNAPSRIEVDNWTTPTLAVDGGTLNLLTD